MAVVAIEDELRPTSGKRNVCIDTVSAPFSPLSSTALVVSTINRRYVVDRSVRSCTAV
jgi:hypothetical protein